MKPRLKPPAPVRDLFAKAGASSGTLGSVILFEPGQRRRSRGRGSNWSPNRQRLAEVTKLIDHRHGGRCDTDDGYAYLEAALPALIELAGGFAATSFEAQITAWASFSVPLLTADEITTCIIAARKRNADQRLHWTARKMGELLRLSIAEREHLEIRMIRPAGMTDRQFADYTRARDAARKMAAARKAGSRPQAESAERQQPWIALGMSRRTYYRRLAAGTLPAGGTTSSGLDTKYLQNRTDRCHGANHTLADPAMGLGSASRIGSANGHAAGGKARAVRPGRPVAPPLPGGEAWAQGDLLGARFPAAAVLKLIAAHLADYAGGPMSPVQRCAVRDLMRHMNLKHGQFGRLIGLSRQQVCNSTRPGGSDGFGPAAAANLRQLLAVAA